MQNYLNEHWNKGGAIYSKGTLNINGCTFEGNTAGLVSVNLCSMLTPQTTHPF
jgi:hypothetical protein